MTFVRGHGEVSLQNNGRQMNSSQPWQCSGSLSWLSYQRDSIVHGWFANQKPETSTLRQCSSQTSKP